MNKNSFTLFEVVISLVIISVVLISIIKLFNNNSNINIYYKLQSIENNYIQNNTIDQYEDIRFKRY